MTSQADRIWAHNRAVQRLIEVHRAEYNQLLDEETEAVANTHVARRPRTNPDTNA